MSESVTDRQMREFKDVFAMFDSDGDGNITGEELGTVMRSLGENPTEEELVKMVADADTDGNGAIDFEEFVEMMALKNKAMPLEEELRATFSVFDRTQRGQFNKEDLREVIINLGETTTDEELDLMVTEVDANNDGYVNYTEFCAIITESSR